MWPDTVAELIEGALADPDLFLMEFIRQLAERGYNHIEILDYLIWIGYNWC